MARSPAPHTAPRSSASSGAAAATKGPASGEKPRAAPIRPVGASPIPTRPASTGPAPAGAAAARGPAAKPGSGAKAGRQRVAGALPQAPAPAARGWRFRFRLLPTMIVFGVLVLGMRVGDTWRMVATAPLIDSAKAATPAAAPTPAPATTPVPVPAPAADAATDKPSPDKPSAAAPAGKAATGDTSPEAGADSGDPNFGNVQMDLLKRLQTRRTELDQRAQQLDEREALLTAAEKRIDRKVTELNDLRANIEKLIGTVDEKQQAQLDSLVKIYETMKPTDAARIFNTLDMPVLLNVFERMKETKTAPIMAAMDPMRAKDVTTQLADRRQLPTLPPQ